MSQTRRLSTVPKHSGKRSSEDYAGIAFFSLAAVVTAGLGFWQLKRYFWKSDLIQKRSENLNYPSIRITDSNWNELYNIEHFQQITLDGQLDFGNLWFVGPRTAPKHYKPKQGNFGYFVLAPFVTSNFVMVLNCGWIPRQDFENFIARNPVPKENLSSPTTINVILAVGEEDDMFSRGAFDRRLPRTLTRFDVEAMRNKIGMQNSTYATLIDELNPNFNLFDVVGLDPVPKNLAESTKFQVEPPTHMGYAFTWWGFAGAALYVMKYIYFR